MLYPELYINLGVNFLQAGLLDEAENSFEKCKNLINEFDLSNDT
jgi:lipopolysaccharide biosynthesis regulator YciM